MNCFSLCFPSSSLKNNSEAVTSRRQPNHNITIRLPFVPYFSLICDKTIKSKTFLKSVFMMQ